MTSAGRSVACTLMAFALLAACGGDGEPTTVPRDDAPPTAPTTAPEPAPDSGPDPEGHPEPTVTTFGVGLFTGAKFTPDGEQIVVIAPGRLLLYPSDDINAEPEIIDLPGQIADAVHSPDGSLLAVGFANGDVHVLDATTYEPDLILEAAVNEWAGVLAISADNRALAVGHEVPNVSKTADNHVFDLATGEVLFTIPEFSTRDFAFGPDGSLLIAADSRTVVTAWDTTTGRETARVTLDDDPFQGNVDLLFNEDGTTLYASENNAGVFALDPVSFEITGPFTDEIGANGNFDMALSPDETTLYVRSTNRLMVFDTATQTAQDTIFVVDPPTLTPPSYRYDLSRDGNHALVLLTQWSGAPFQRLELWNVADKERIAVNEESNHAVNLIDISADGNEVAASAADGRLQIWDIRGAEPILVDDLRDVHLGSLTDDAAHVVGGVPADDALVVARRSRADGTDVALDDLRFRARVLFMTDGGLVTARRMAYNRATDRVAVVDGDRLAVATSTGGEQVFTVDDVADAETLVFSRDGSILAVGGDDLIHLFAGDTGELVQSVALEDTRPTLALSPDGQHVAVVVGRFASSASIQVFRVGEAEPFAVLRPEAGADALTFSHDGSSLAFSTDDGIQRYDITSETFTDPITTGERLFSLSYGADDNTIIGGTSHGTLIRIDLG